MINDFMFYNPVQIYFGREQMQHLPEVLAQYGKKILLVYGGTSIKRTGLYQKIIDQLEQCTIFELSGVEPNPDVTSVREGVTICKREKIDVILAVGGGSVIDASKWIAAGACVEHDPWDFFCKKTSITEALPLVTVLTIAATGSEMNNGGVISNRELGKKIGRSSPLLYPKASFLNPEVTCSVSPFQTACGVVDILSHIMEVYFHNGDSFAMLDSIMESIMKTVIQFGPIAFNEPDNYEARANLMWAASWAINGFINGGVRQGWNCHTIEHELSATYDITHGLGLAILIPRWLSFGYSEQNKERYRRFGSNVLGLSAQLSDDEMLRGILTGLEDLFYNKLQLTSNLSDLQIAESDMPELAQRLCQNGPLQGFLELNREDVLEILKSCCESVKME